MTAGTIYISYPVDNRTELQCRARDGLENAETGRFSPAPLNLLADMPLRGKYFRRDLYENESFHY